MPIAEDRARPRWVQPPGDQVLQQGGRDCGGLGVAFPQPQNLLVSRDINAQRDHHGVVTEHNPIDQDDGKVPVPQRGREPRG